MSVNEAIRFSDFKIQTLHHLNFGRCFGTIFLFFTCLPDVFILSLFNSFKTDLDSKLFFIELTIVSCHNSLQTK